MGFNTIIKNSFTFLNLKSSVQELHQSIASLKSMHWIVFFAISFVSFHTSYITSTMFSITGSVISLISFITVSILFSITFLLILLGFYFMNLFFKADISFGNFYKLIVGIHLPHAIVSFSIFCLLYLGSLLGFLPLPLLWALFIAYVLVTVLVLIAFFRILTLGFQTTLLKFLGVSFLWSLIGTGIFVLLLLLLTPVFVILALVGGVAESIDNNNLPSPKNEQASPTTVGVSNDSHKETTQASKSDIRVDQFSGLMEKYNGLDFSSDEELIGNLESTNKEIGISNNYALRFPNGYEKEVRFQIGEFLAQKEISAEVVLVDRINNHKYQQNFVGNATTKNEKGLSKAAFVTFSDVEIEIDKPYNFVAIVGDQDGSDFSIISREVINFSSGKSFTNFDTYQTIVTNEDLTDEDNHESLESFGVSHSSFSAPNGTIHASIEIKNAKEKAENNVDIVVIGTESKSTFGITTSLLPLEYKKISFKSIPLTDSSFVVVVSNDNGRLVEVRD